MKLGEDKLYPLVHDFLKIYLPNHRRVSPHTVRAYRDSLHALLHYIKERESVALYQVTLDMLTTEAILSFLESLDSAGLSDATHNSRVAAIRAFLDYASDRDITLTARLNELRKISFRKSPANRIIKHVSMNAITAIAEQADEDTRKGFRDRFFMMLMYDTAARVQEMVGLRLCDLKFEDRLEVTLHGKGGKERVIPAMENTGKHLLKYLSVFHDGEPLSSEAPLFYAERGGKRKPLSDRAIRYMLQEYGTKARSVCPEVPEHVYPHLFRHSRAMHLYQAGMNMETLSQWLGHSKSETTRIYAYADTEHKRKAIEASTPPDSPLRSHLNASRYTVTDEETLERLVGLR